MAVSSSKDVNVAGDAAIRPFRIDVPQEEIDGLRSRIAASAAFKSVR
jgi:hypothetical protein